MYHFKPFVLYISNGFDFVIIRAWIFGLFDMLKNSIAMSLAYVEISPIARVN